MTKLRKARQSQTRHDKGRQGKTKKGSQARHLQARQNKVRHDKTRLGQARQRQARRDKSRQGKAKLGKTRQSQAKQVEARPGNAIKARQDTTRQNKAKQDTFCLSVPFIVQSLRRGKAVRAVLNQARQVSSVGSTHCETNVIQRDMTSESKTQKDEKRQDKPNYDTAEQSKARLVVSWCFEPSQLQRKGKTR